MQPTGEWLDRPGGLAERLERMRKAARLTGVQLAEQLGWPRSKISKLENGRQMPTAADLTAWAGACGQPEALAGLQADLDQAEAVHRQYRHQLRRGNPAIQEDFDKIVRQAKRIRNIEVAIIPGLLQTADYARYRALEAVRVHGYPEDGVEATVAARMRRQEILYEGDREFEFVITEAALRLLLCPPQVMLGQIDRLAGLSGLAHITLGIIPFGVELPIAPMHAFLITDDRACVETHASDIPLVGEEAAAYGAIADGMLTEAVTGDDARRLLAAAAEALR